MSWKREKTIDIGQPPPAYELSHTESVCLKFHDFKNLFLTSRGRVHSPDFKCHGHDWSVRILKSDSTCFTRWREDINVDLGLVSSQQPVVCALEVFDYNDTCYESITEHADTSAPSKQRGEMWQWEKFATLGDLIPYLTNGTLTIKVRLKVYQKAKPSMITLKNTFVQDVHRMINDENSTSSQEHVKFLVGSEKKTLTAYAPLLRVRSPEMAALLLKDDDEAKEIIIDDVQADNFKALLDFIHHREKVSYHASLIRDPLGVLKAANRFGVWQMKILAEEQLVGSLTETNAVDLLLLAEALCCPLLKEGAMKMVATKIAAVKQSSDWNRLKESKKLLLEIIEAFDDNKEDEEDYDDEDDEKDEKDQDKTSLNHLSVRDIYEKLQEKGLPLDGTRGMMLKRLSEEDKSLQEQPAKRHRGV